MGVFVGHLVVCIIMRMVKYASSEYLVQTVNLLSNIFDELPLPDDLLSFAVFPFL